MNLNNLRVFERVYSTRCMTTASRDLHLTQSGVSQHIKALEESLGVQLFDRINKKLIPTEAGDRLYNEAHPALYRIEEAILGLSQQETQLRGSVRIGMPIEFGTNVLIPLLAEIGRQHPSICFELQLDFASKINALLLDAKLDFAFVDDFQMDRRIQVEQVAEETLLLCATRSYLADKGPIRDTKSFFEGLEYVAYQESEPVLRSWFSHHNKRKNLKLEVRARVMDVQGVARFILNHFGVGALPDHLVHKLVEHGHDLHIFDGCGRPLRNHISIAYLKGRSRPPAVSSIIDELRRNLQAKHINPA